jgi:hypothetical protein
MTTSPTRRPWAEEHAEHVARRAATMRITWKTPRTRVVYTISFRYPSGEPAAMVTAKRAVVQAAMEAFGLTPEQMNRAMATPDDPHGHPTFTRPEK